MGSPSSYADLIGAELISKDLMSTQSTFVGTLPSSSTLQSPSARETPFILVIDESAASRRMLRLAMKWGRRPEQVELTLADDCESSLRAIMNGDAPLPSLILLDPRRQGQRCLNALKLLKQNDRTHSIPVIAWTVPGDPSVDEAYAASANCVLVKPETVEETATLLTRIQRFWFSSSVMLPRPLAANKPS